MRRLEIHTFGGFEVRRGDRRLTDLESRKVEALGAYLIAHRHQSVHRDHLAALLWPDRPDSSARRNLRQALYNLRSTIEGDGPRCFVVDGRSVQFEPHRNDWIDLDPFERMLLPDDGSSAADPLELAAAVRLYRGEFLEGLVAPSLSYEEWLLGEQERYREAVLRALRELVEHALTTGDYETGIRYARRLVRIDPLSEEAHRKLIRLYALSGRRGRALAHYDSLVDLLDRELGVEPLEETTALCLSIRDGEAPAVELSGIPEPTGPVLHLVGRGDALAALEAPWREVLAGHGRLTLVVGDHGVGKTRLVKTFLHERVSDVGATVLQGGWFELEPPVPYRGIHDALDDLLAHELDAVERVLRGASAGELADLALLVPRLASAEGAPRLRGARSGQEPRERTVHAVGRALELIATGAGAEADSAPGAPVILFLEDLQWADASSLELLCALVPRITGQPIWLLATVRPGAAAHDRLRELPGTDEIHLPPLTRDDLQALSESLVGPVEAEMLTDLLMRRTDGNALHASTLINLLWDRGVVEPVEDGGWHLADDPREIELPDDGLDAVARARTARLPPSARRLLTLAAVAGPRFEPALLGDIEGEEEVVVEASLRTLLERWFVRLSLGYWADSRRDRDMVIWAGGARRGTFEFSHGALRRSVYRTLDPSRRRALHAKVAAALELRIGPPYRIPPEVLARHFREAGDAERARQLLDEAAARAEALGAVQEPADASSEAGAPDPSESTEQSPPKDAAASTLADQARRTAPGA